MTEETDSFFQTMADAQARPVSGRKVACTSCAQCKRSCDGVRPSCGRCSAGSLKCSYRTSTASGTGTGNGQGPAHATQSNSRGADAETNDRAHMANRDRDEDGDGDGAAARPRTRRHLRKRRANGASCGPCRANKKACDGARPICSRCKAMANASCVYTALIYDGSGQHEFEMQSPTEFAPRFLPPPFLEPDVGMFPMIPMPLGSAGHISNLGIPIPQYHHQLSHFASHNHVLSPVFPLPDVVVADQQPASNSTRTETLSTFRDAEAADALLSAAVHRHSVLVHLPDDYAQTLYPSVPKGLLPPPDQLRALINAYFSHQLDKIHRPTFEARVCRGEDLARAGYRDAMRSRREFWASGGTDDQSRPVTVQWRETDAVEAHMDPVLLVSVLWTGSSILQSLAERDGDDSVIEIAAKLDPTVWEEMKSWLDSENKEFVGWFGLEDVPGLQRLREEMMGRDPGQLWDGDQHGSSQPKTLPFVGQHLSPAEKYLHAHLMHTFHRDIFDAALSFSISLWATFQLGRLRQTFGAAALLSRVFNMMRCHESVPRAHADDRDRPAVWIRDEEKLRMFSQVLTGEVLFREVWTSFASQTQRTQMSTNFMPLQERLFDDLEVPCNELLFNSLPAAIEAYQDGRHGTQVPTTYSLYLQSPSGHPRWTATRRDVGFWLDLPRTAPQRIASLKLGFGRILDLGAWALAMGVAELMRTFHRLCTWFGEQGVEVHSLAAVGGREEVGPEVREQAAALRLSFIEALDDVTDNLPEALKEAYTTGDGSAMKKLGVMYFGTPGWPTL